MKSIKQTNIKNRTYEFFNDMIWLDICYIGYIIMKNIGDYESIHGVNPLYFIIGELDGYIEEKIKINIWL